MKTIEFEKWVGEFGWEIMTWAPYCRWLSQEFDKAIISTFNGMTPLYDDFAEVIFHQYNRRGFNHPKMYRLLKSGKAIYRKYGIPNPKYDILLHMRGCGKKSNYNYTNWQEVVDLLGGEKVACIGTYEDKYFEDVSDERDIPLQDLMNLIAGAKVVVGVSSGVMHLAMACDTPVVVWGDDRTYFGEFLEKRYTETWNPFKTEVKYLMEKNFQPKPEDIVKELRKLI